MTVEEMQLAALAVLYLTRGDGAEWAWLRVLLTGCVAEPCPHGACPCSGYVTRG